MTAATASKPSSIPAPPTVDPSSTIVQPIILTPSDSFPSPMTVRSPPPTMYSPTTMFLNMPDEDLIGFFGKRKRGNAQDDDDHFGAKFAHIDSPVSASSPDEDTSNLEDYASRRPGRKPMLDDDCLSITMEHDAKTKRKAQNRAAQRAFRERKERYVKELEIKIKQVQDGHAHTTARLVEENHHLRSIIYRLEAENFALKGIHIQFPMHPSPYYMFTPPSPPSTYVGATAKISDAAALLPVPLLAPGPPPPPPLSMMHQQQQQPQPQQYTFSISTPATLRPKKSQEEQFVEAVKSQVSNNAIDKLLSEPLFDHTGGLIRSPSDNDMALTKVLTCPEIWKRLSKHERFSFFTMKELCQEVSRRARPSEHQGPVLDESELEAVLKWMSSKSS